MVERVYRSRDEKMLAGVCGGLAEYFKIDPVLVRALMIVLILMGPGVPLYLVLWVIVPLAPTPPQASD